MLTFLGVNDFKMIPSVEYCSRFVELKTNFTRNLIKIKKILNFETSYTFGF